MMARRSPHLRLGAPLLLIGAAGVLAGCSERETGSAALALDTSDCPDWTVGPPIVGTAGDDIITGGPEAECIFGLDGDDTIDGGGGDDFIVGGAGSDAIVGGNGSDIIYGDDGDDTIAGSNGSDTIDGGAGNDVLTGDNGPDSLTGGPGNDVVLEGRGPATIDGGDGAWDACIGTDCELLPVSMCDVDGDCLAPQRCEGGACIYCLADSECVDGELCDGTETCAPALPSCVPGVPAPAGLDTGLPCSLGIGSCARVGSFICDGMGAHDCDAVPGLPTSDDSDCDGRDDDCDGSPDEDFVPHPITCGLGACEAAGLQICPPSFPGVPRAPADICAPGAPSPEVCNATDDDCDGGVDEDLARLITCGSVASCEDEGLEYCQLGVLRDTCDFTEVCDGRDNDCDHVVDEGFDSVAEVCDRRDQDCDGRVDESGVSPDGTTPSMTTDQDHDTLCDNPVPGLVPGTFPGVGPDRCPFHPDVVALNPGSAFVIGRLYATSAGGPEVLPLASTTVRTALGEVLTDCEGRYMYALPPDDMTSVVPGPFHLNFVVSGRVPGPEVVAGAGPITSVARVTDDLGYAWGSNSLHGCCDDGFGRWANSIVETRSDGRRTRFVDAITLTTSEAQIHRVGVMIADDYLRAVRRPFPNGILSFMRPGGLVGPFIYVDYDYFRMTENVLNLNAMNNPTIREDTLFHESGHIFRHILDGNRAHWENDLFRFALGRCHNGTEIFQEGYAFNEGWADYWRDARWSRVADRESNPTPEPFTAPPLTCENCRLPGIDLTVLGPTDPLPPDHRGALVTDYCDAAVGLEGVALTPRHVDWVERLVAGRLLFLANNCFPGMTFDEADSVMVSVLENNPGGIHRIWEFEQALAARLAALGLPACVAIRTTPPLDCPPNFTDDGESCSQWTGVSWHVIHEP